MKVLHINVLVREMPKNLEPVFRDTEKELWAGVDQGVFSLLKTGIRPEYTYGDFDSVTESERMYIKEQLDINPVPTEKDDTDLALCLTDLVSKGYDSIHVYGATGGRMDHALANVHLLMHEALREAEIKILDHQNVIRLLPSGDHTVSRQSGMKYVSFIPINDRTELSLSGFLYNLDGEFLEFGTTLTISNEFTGDTGKVTSSHDILMIQSKD